MRASRYPYRLVNVFAETPFSGITVAVFHDATGLETAQMSAIARELNLPQCAFVFPPRGGSTSPRVQIFTPAVELPRTGLPMIATAFALQIEKSGSRPPVHDGGVRPRERVVLEQAEGPVSVAVFSPVLTVRQNSPVFGATYPERETIAALLSLRGDQLGAAPFEVASSGVPYLVVFLKNVQALSQVRIRDSIWDRTLRYFEAPNILAFALKGGDPGAFAHLRVFTPAYGVVEESASETASGPLVGYALRHGLARLPESRTVVLRQGDEIGRPSALHVTVELADDRIEQLRVGGQCALIGEGVIFV